MRSYDTAVFEFERQQRSRIIINKDINQQISRASESYEVVQLCKHIEQFLLREAGLDTSIRFHIVVLLAPTLRPGSYRFIRFHRGSEGLDQGAEVFDVLVDLGWVLGEVLVRVDDQVNVFFGGDVIVGEAGRPAPGFGEGGVCLW